MHHSCNYDGNIVPLDTSRDNFIILGRFQLKSPFAVMGRQVEGVYSLSGGLMFPVFPKAFLQELRNVSQYVTGFSALISA